MGAPLSRDQECERILQVHARDDFERISVVFDRQFRTIHNRAQLLLGICSVLISANVLVSAGRLIGRVSPSRPVVGFPLLVAGVLAITAAGVICSAVARVRWTTQQSGDDLRSWVLTNLAYRDAKTRAYRLSVWLVMLSMLAYQAAVTMALTQL